MRNLIAKQVCETPEKTVIQRTYIYDGKPQTISEVWYPRISWFRPPCIKLFKRAYKTYIDMSNVVKIIETDFTPFTSVSDVSENGKVTQIGIQITREE